ncbi:histone-like nucleoid-structuring protein Lsr2 [Corynebacterium anserum]|uniref:Lsr2 family protein n=1 Tax=Corynebacterium anserum TaxID=2684406 RepID=A0A7G7YLK3_9CORY|nr:Lsr2 family protein [Corynebacterium anserum]MBC2681470.1 Lsr2 family protein [Corynebacterium anserum]QNH95373.1 Lsr2 family protein [Corynebacterium anserum]
MARREVTQYFDDLDNSLLADGDVNIIDFSIGGVDYTMELGPENKRKFDDAIAPFIAVARRATKRASGRKSTASSGNAARNKRIREWAHENNIAVSERGRISADVVEQFNKATNSRA